MALLASPFDIFSSLFSFFFSIGKGNSFFLLVMFVKYLSVFSSGLESFKVNSLLIRILISHMFDSTFSFPFRTFSQHSLCFDQFGWCFTQHVHHVLSYSFRRDRASEVDVTKVYLSPLPTSSATSRQSQKKKKRNLICRGIPKGNLLQKNIGYRTYRCESISKLQQKDKKKNIPLKKKFAA